MPDVFAPELLNQTATYWAPSTRDGAGKITFGAPVSVTCRWADATELFIDRQGKEVRSNAVVHVDQDLSLDGFLALGASVSATPTDGALPIRKLAKTPGLDAEMFVRKAWL